MVDTTDDGQVVMAFNQEVDYLKLNPQQAVALAEAILQKAISLAPPGALDSNLILPGQF